MTYWNAALLGLVQGLAEFLPISSSGHLAVLQNFLAIGDMENHMLFDVLLHLGTLAAVILAFWKDVREVVTEFLRMLHLRRTPRGLKPNRRERRLISFAGKSASFWFAMLAGPADIWRRILALWRRRLPSSACSTRKRTGLSLMSVIRAMFTSCSPDAQKALTGYVSSAVCPAFRTRRRASQTLLSPGMHPTPFRSRSAWRGQGRWKSRTTALSPSSETARLQAGLPTRDLTTRARAGSL